MTIFCPAWPLPRSTFSITTSYSFGVLPAMVVSILAGPGCTSCRKATAIRIPCGVKSGESLPQMPQVLLAVSRAKGRPVTNCPFNSPGAPLFPGVTPVMTASTPSPVERVMISPVSTSQMGCPSPEKVRAFSSK